MHKQRRDFNKKLGKITLAAALTSATFPFTLNAKSKEQPMKKIQHITAQGKIGQMQNMYGYCSAVKIGNVVEISGQGGWDREFNFPHKNLLDEITQAFENVEFILQSAGTSFKNVYSVHSYFTQPITPEVNEFMATQFKKRCQKPPLWTCLQVAGLGDKRMRVEIEVKAYVGS